MTTDYENGTRTLDEAAQASAENRSVIERPRVASNSPPGGQYLDTQFLWFLSGYADDIPVWNKVNKARDAKLRQFILEEPIFASALGIICSRNAGFSWTLDGPIRTVTRLQDIFDLADMGEGWHDLIIKTSIDLYTQENGAFWEIVRQQDSEDSPIVGVNYLDSQRCWHTGVRAAPVVYQDMRGGFHILKRHNVITLSEMPSPIEAAYGQQYCVLSRLLRSLKMMRNIETYKEEKTGGRNTKAIHLVKGVTSQQVQDAIAEAKAFADNSGLTRFMTPVVVGTLDPTADVGHDTIDLAGMPDGYNEAETFKQYIALIAMAFASDYQDFAPLPGGGLGTGAQSEMLHLKSRGKGPGLFMKIIAHAINMRLLPSNTKWVWTEQDLEAEKSKAEVQAIRAQTRAIRIASGEISPFIARQIAQDEGDLTQEYLDLMGEEDYTTDVTITDDTQASAQTDNSTSGKQPPPEAKPGQIQTPANSNPQQPKRIPSRRANPPLMGNKELSEVILKNK